MNHKIKSIVSFLIVVIISMTSISAQNIIKSPKGYTTEIGNIVSMLEDLKGRVTNSVEHLNQDETDFLLDANANRIGALIYHLAATEKYYQVFTFESRGFNKEEAKMWEEALSLGDSARENLKGKPITYYLELWDSVRRDTKKLLKTKDDDWFSQKVEGSSMNNHWAWYHVMEHQANHMGQIRFFIKRIE